jgi:hypothetical protein
MIEDKINEINEAFSEIVHKMDKVSADEVGLDIRAGYGLWVCEDGIAVSQAGDRALQYYGGFEYVDKEYRVAIGDWVFYSANADRVAQCLDRYTTINC